MVDRNELRDHAAHRGADDMGALDPERVEKPGRVGGHVVQRIGRERRAAGFSRDHHGGKVWRAELGEKSRASDVAIVEPHDPEVAGDEPVAYRVPPARQRRIEPMDQKDRGIAIAPEAVVGDVYPVGADLGHGCSFAKARDRGMAVGSNRARGLSSADGQRWTSCNILDLRHEGARPSLQRGGEGRRHPLSLRRARQPSRHAYTRRRRHRGPSTPDDGEYRRGAQVLRARFRRRGQMHDHAGRHVGMGRVQQGLRDLFRPRPPARSLGLRMQWPRARRQARSRVHRPLSVNAQGRKAITPRQ